MSFVDRLGGLFSPPASDSSTQPSINRTAALAGPESASARRAAFSEVSQQDQRDQQQQHASVLPSSSLDTRPFGIDFGGGSAAAATTAAPKTTAVQDMKPGDGEIQEEGRPPYLHAMIAGGIGGLTGDMLMHSLDTVKTRQQGDPHVPPKYNSLGSSYYTIMRQEGLRRGLYGGWLPAAGGSFPGTMIFFGTYEWSKRVLIDNGLQQHISYLAAGFLGDLAASVVYVPSEVLKTRLQLQGRYNNPYFSSGYNYRGTLDAARTIVRTEGTAALFYGYKATLYRDLPFSALQFMFWEQFLVWARDYKGSREVGAPLELLTGGLAGGLAGVMTCPLDVVKTRLQTQLHPEAQPDGAHKAGGASNSAHASNPQKRNISTSSPSTHTPRPGAANLQTSSVIRGLRAIYQSEGISGWFRGVGPRGVWTFIQSGTMLFLYQRIIHQLELWNPQEDQEQEQAL